MTDTNNISCQFNEEDFYFEENQSDLNKYLGLSLTIFSSLYFPLCYFYFLRKRAENAENPKLKLRSLVLLGYFCLGVIALTYGTAFINYYGERQFPCNVSLIILTISIGFGPTSVFARTVTLYFRLTFNKAVLDYGFQHIQNNNSLFFTTENDFFHDGTTSKAPKGSIFDSFGRYVLDFLYFILRWNHPTSLPRSLRATYFLSSVRFIVFFYIVVFSIEIIFLFSTNNIKFPLRERCVGCTSIDFAVSTSVCISILTFLWLIIIFKLRNFTDSLGLKTEIIWSVSIITVPYLLLTLPLKLSLGVSVETQFDIDYITIFSSYICGYYIFVYQINNALRTRLNSTVELNLEKLLSTSDGLKSFAAYCASELAVESLAFYMSAKRWRANFLSLTPEKRRKRAEKMYELYIRPNSAFEINISGDEKHVIRKNLDQNFNEELFDVCIRDILYLMSSDLFPRYLNSSYYKAFKNQLNFNPDPISDLAHVI